MQTVTGHKKFAFLSGGGEMGELIRGVNWSSNPLGSPDTWPKSLQTTLGIILHSAFPMFLFWGRDLVCFYNDAFRPSLGIEGKHPAIGKKGKEVWPEIWDFIGPLIEQVMNTGEPVWFEDQLVPFYRNGRMEDIYWTFSYSPAYGDGGEVNGVFVTCTETTDKINNVRQLEENKDQLAFAIEAAELGTFDYNPLTNKFTANDRLKEWFGFSFTSDIELPEALNVIIEKDRKRVAEAIRHSLNFESGGRFDMEYVIEHPLTKRQTIVRAKGRTWFNEERKAYRLNGTLQDVTGEVTARNKLEEVVKELVLFKFMAGRITDFIGVCDMNYVPFYMNPEGMKLVGLEHMEQVATTRLTDYFFPEDQDFILNQFVPEVMREGNAEVEIRFRHFKTGEPIWMIYNVMVVHDAEGIPMGLATISKNINQRKQAEQALTKTTRHLQLALAAGMLGSYELDLATGYISCTSQCRQNFGWSGKEGIPLKVLLQMIHPDDRPKLEEGILRAVEDHIIFTNDLRITWPDGSLHWVHFAGLPVYNEENRVVQLTGVTADITDQKLFAAGLESKVEQRTKELADTNEALTRTNLELGRTNANLQEFAYAASHDLKEPIRKIHFFSDKLKNSLARKLSEDEWRSFERMEVASNRMSSLIDDLLMYSQVSLRPAQFEEVNLNQVLNLVLGDLDLEIEEKNASINVGELCIIRGHYRQLQQAFQNLLANALKYSKPGTSPVINVSCIKIPGRETGLHLTPEENAKDYFLVEVKDNGIGFEQKDADRIFNVFTRLHGNNEFRGTGIGLSIVRKVIENHMGFISAESNPGEGANFKILFPVMD